MKKGKILLIIANVVVAFAIYLSLKDREEKEMSFDEILISTLSNMNFSLTEFNRLGNMYFDQTFCNLSPSASNQHNIPVV